MRTLLLATLRRLFATSLFLGLCAVSIEAQSDLTTVVGSIHDPTGASVANATVTVKNQNTGAERKANTNEAGNYVIPSVPAGAVTLIVEAAGFKKYEQSGNTIQANVTATLDATLTLGQASETVQVTSEAPPVQSDSATLGRDITTKQIRDLQLNGRNPYLLSLLKPGVSGGSIAGFSFGLNNGLNVNGSRNQETLLTQDGAVAVRTRSNGTSIGVADADATQEVQILTSNYNAEYGRSAGGQIRIVTKGGGRDFHGTAYEYFRNSALDANSWSRNNSPDPTLNRHAAPFKFNQFGYNVSGPVFIPKVFNANRNRFFFLFGQEYLRYRQDVQNDLNSYKFVPSAAMRRGDFSELLGSNPFYSGVRVIRDSAGNPYPNNVIPQRDLSPNGLALLTVYPAANRTGNLNYQATAAGPQNQRKDTGSIDILPADNHYIRFRVLNYEFNQVIPFASNYLVIPQFFDRPNQSTSINYTWNVSPTVVNEFLVSASRDQVYINIDRSNGLYNRNIYGVNGINYPFLLPGKNIPEKIPTITLNGPFGELSGLPYPSSSTGPIYDVSDNVSKIWGNHNFKVGFLFERAGQNDYDQINVAGVPGGTNNQNGRFVFQDSTPGGTGLSVANAARGIFDTYAELGTRSYTPYRGQMYEWFAQDSWKITPKLHIDYGLRHSIIQPYYSLWRNMAVFDPTYYNPATAVRTNRSTGAPIPNSGDIYDGILIPGSGFPAAAHGRVLADPYPGTSPVLNLFRGRDKSYSDTHSIQGLQPRVGVAYSFNQKTVIRAGVGRYLTRLGVSDSVFLGGNPPFQPSASVTGSGLTNIRVDNPGGGAQNTFPLPLTTQDPIFYNPEAWAWNAAVQREVGFQTTVEVAYVGRRGLHLQQETNINQLLPGTLQANPGVNADALRPYQGFGAIRSTNNTARSIYHALQVDVNRRFTNGLLFGVAYSWSKSTDTGSAQRDVVPNAYGDRSLLYGLSDFDRRHVAVINVIYQLPFFKDRARWTGKLLGGWQISEITQLQSGTPFSVQTGDDFAGVGPGSGSGSGMASRWIVNGKIDQTAKFADNGGQWYAFQKNVNILQPAAGTFSNQRSRNIFTGPGFQQWSAGIFKDFGITEQQAITMRFEIFNWINHPNWGGETGGGVDANPNDSNFGRVTNKGGQRQLQLSLRYSF